MKKFLLTCVAIVSMAMANAQDTVVYDNTPLPPKRSDSSAIVSDKVFQVVEEMPEYPGGESAMMTLIQKNIQYPDDAREIGVQGRVVIGFVVEEDGSIKDIAVKRGVWPSMDKEAVRVVKLIDHFKPGKQQGKAVKVQFVLPIMMRLSGGDFNPLLNPKAGPEEDKANAACARGKYAKALPLYRAICEADPNNNFARHNLGICLYMTEDKEGAIMQWTKLRDKNCHTADFLIMKYIGYSAKH